MAVDFDALVLAPLAEIFGEPVPARLVPGDGPPVEFTAIFVENAQESKFQDGIETITLRTWVGCRRTAFARDPAQDEIVEVRSRSYTIAEVHADTMGHLKLYLHGPH